jgi:hypothetical protein
MSHLFDKSLFHGGSQLFTSTYLEPTTESRTETLQPVAANRAPVSPHELQRLVLLQLNGPRYAGHRLDLVHHLNVFLVRLLAPARPLLVLRTRARRSSP